jgi:protease I
MPTFRHGGGRFPARSMGKNEGMSQTKPLQGLRVAILVDDGFEQVEMTEPRKALDEAGAKTFIVSPQKSQVQGWNHDEKADVFPVDVTLSVAKPVEFDALLLPGGVRNPDALRMDNKAVLFAHAFEISKKPIAAICHGPWMLIEIGAVRGRKMTSWPSLRTDVINAGGDWVDQAVVADGPLVTSRKPDDIPQFNKAMLELFTPAIAAAT